ncbi:putative methyltransferase (plasmid) [Gemmatirosa kalamazoonensis]|uniref:Putative methyltransferase n=1 Tax=Gemmatirosa kalamazoonensis TaxID=861299 RepID=W0RQB9_9BACT|nr:class I SAM-dependent methyltransferase [Gemmatirosa kalamazoonensis]AHG92916.1 putative methyltransferase [Gemmatirosa kalamazoonensis]
MTPVDVYPIRLGPADAFAAARDCLERGQFEERVVARRLGRETLIDFPRLAEGRTTLAGPVEDANAALVRLLIDGEPLPAARAEALCGAAGIAALRDLGVLVPDGDDPSRLVATVLLAPTHGVWIAQDTPPRRAGVEVGSTVSMARDVVFPAFTELTGQFLGTLEFAAGARVLELCAGTGVAALIAARRGAAEAWATDITERSVHFERWNAALNGFTHVRAVRSDAWDGLAGETFDRVYAHPPYVPALTHVYDYRDAGEDGEHVSRRIVQGLPEHLRPGGRCAMTCALTDRTDAPVEQRIRGWLGDAAPEFDLVLLQRRDWDALHAFRSVTRRKEGYAGVEAWLEHFHALRIERFVHCSFELRRDAVGRRPVTVRRRAGARVDAAAVDFAYRWARHVAAGGTAEARLTGQRPRVVPGTQLRTSRRADERRHWLAVGATVVTDYPVAAAVDLPPAAPKLLELCDGARDVPALHAALRRAGAVGNDVTVANVAELVELLLSVGALEVPACPVPAPPNGT